MTDREAVQRQRYLDAVCDRFEAALRAGQRPDLPAALAEASAAEQATLLPELVALDVEYRYRAGECPVVEDYVGRFPDHATLIAATFREANVLEASLDPKQPRATSATDSLGTVDGQAAEAGGMEPTILSGSEGTVEGAGGIASSSRLRFRILRHHAKGGLGQVFVARDEELDREVALKEIQDKHAANQESRNRFLLEAEITGRLEHPGVVPVYGLGQYADGRPFYAMRFIRGQSLKEAIEEYHRRASSRQDDVGDASHVGLTPRRSPDFTSLEFRKLLGRLIDVCNAIQYAHDCGVLHRDLKPANIMLGKYGETLVVDWGLAKVLARAETPGNPELQRAFADSSQTVPGLVLGTPGYLSPEQAAGNLDEVGPASDIYSLGATLYCLVTGQGPMTTAEESCPSVAEILRKVEAGDFPGPRQVNPAVDPALEAIVVKAMALRPGDRYTSARQLADDLEHWLADEPVGAWTEPWSVQARRWINRHRTLMTGTAAAILVGLLGLAIATVLLTQANRDLEQANTKERTATNEAIAATTLAENRRREADDARKEAVEDAAAAKQMATFMAGLFEQADPFVLGGRFLGEQPLTNPTALDLIDRGAPRLADPRFLSEKPLVRAGLLDKVGKVYLSLGEGAKAEPFILEALALRQKHLRGDADDLAASLHNVAFLHLTKGNVKKSGALFDEAVAMRTRLFGIDSAPAVTSRLHLGLALSFQEPELARAETLLLEVLEVHRRQLKLAEKNKADEVGKDALECVCTLVFLCNVHLRRGEPLKALPRVAEIQQALNKVTNKEFASFISNFISYQQWKALKQGALAEKSLRQALTALEKRVGKHHYLHGLLEREMAVFLFESGRHEDAEKLFLGMEESYRKSFVGDAAGLSHIYSLLAQSIERGALAKARRDNDKDGIRNQAARVRHYFRAAFLNGKKCDIDWYSISMYGTDLARTHLELSPEPDLAEAEQAARECWHLRKDKFGADHELCFHPFNYLLTILSRQNKSEELEKTFLEFSQLARAPKWRQGSHELLPDIAAQLVKAGRTKTAVLVLQQAIAAGTTIDRIRNDAAFAPLHKLDGYQTLIRK